ncbi:recombinase family protein [Kribbella deserti]|uniref:Recombinase family protein n=1 Tax=Kribbella deserti TaxID=1926257 RepID=A0ABV6QIC1_9ACTN
MKPIALGYVRTNPLTTRGEITAAKEHLAAYAVKEDLTLDRVYVDRPESQPEAYHALIEALQRRGIRLVLVPSLAHLGGHGSPLKTHLEHYTHARILITQTA